MVAVEVRVEPGCHRRRWCRDFGAHTIDGGGRGGAVALDLEKEPKRWGWSGAVAQQMW
jgi:hypothetical protein